MVTWSRARAGDEAGDNLGVVSTIEEEKPLEIKALDSNSGILILLALL